MFCEETQENICQDQSPLAAKTAPPQILENFVICCLTMGDSIRPCTNGVSLLHRIASVAPLIKPQTMY